MVSNFHNNIFIIDIPYPYLQLKDTNFFHLKLSLNSQNLPIKFFDPKQVQEWATQLKIFIIIKTILIIIVSYGDIVPRSLLLHSNILHPKLPSSSNIPYRKLSLSRTFSTANFIKFSSNLKLSLSRVAFSNYKFIFSPFSISNFIKIFSVSQIFFIPQIFFISQTFSISRAFSI